MIGKRRFFYNLPIFTVWQVSVPKSQPFQIQGACPKDSKLRGLVDELFPRDVGRLRRSVAASKLPSVPDADTGNDPKSGLRCALIIQQTCRSSFSAVPKPILQMKFSLYSIVQDLDEGVWGGSFWDYKDCCSFVFLCLLGNALFQICLECC